MTPDSPESLVDCVCKLLDDPDACRAMGEMGRQFVQHEYDRTVLADHFLQLISELVSEEGQARPVKKPQSAEHAQS